MCSVIKTSEMITVHIDVHDVLIESNDVNSVTVPIILWNVCHILKVINVLYQVSRICSQDAI